MSHENPKITDFKDLVAWQKAHGLAVNIYKATEIFPKGEQFGLTNQVRRAIVSVASNIAEGFGRRTKADRIHFYDMARASLHEVQAQLMVARDVGFMQDTVHEKIDTFSIECHKILTGLINKTNGTK